MTKNMEVVPWRDVRPGDLLVSVVGASCGVLVISVERQNNVYVALTVLVMWNDRRGGTLVQVWTPQLDDPMTAWRRVVVEKATSTRDLNA